MRFLGRTPRQFTMAHGLMVLAGIVTFLTVSSVLRERGETLEVVVADDELVAGSSLDGASFSTTEIGVSSPLVGQMATADDLAGGGLLGRDLTAGDPLLVSDIRPLEDHSTLRTIAIPVWRSTIDGLGLRVGDRVDLIGLDQSGTLRFVVTDSAVSRLPSASGGGAFGSESGRESWITVQVSDQDALALAQALRSGDVEVVRSTGAPTLVTPQNEIPDPLPAAADSPAETADAADVANAGETS